MKYDAILLLDAVVKGERHVKTPAGERRFHLPIGAPIRSLPTATARIWPADAERPSDLDVVDSRAMRDQYLPAVFGEPAQVSSAEHQPFHPILHGKMEKNPNGYVEGPPVWQNFDESHMPRKDLGTTPITHVYRGMSLEEWQQAQERGYISSDRRGTLMPDWEGTNAGVNADTALHYVPRNGQSIIVQIKVDPKDGWFTSDADSYLRTRENIPLSRVLKTTGIIHTVEGHVVDITDPNVKKNTDNGGLDMYVPGMPGHKRNCKCADCKEARKQSIMSKAITPGGRVGDASPLGKPGGPRRLVDYIREIAHALMRNGMSESHAIAVARSALARWASGAGNVSPKVRAAAAKALAEQQALDKGRRVAKHDPITFEEHMALRKQMRDDHYL